MFLWQFNDGLGWRGGEQGFPTVDAARAAALEWRGERWPNDHLRVLGKVSEPTPIDTGYRQFWWQDGQDAEERTAPNGI